MKKGIPLNPTIFLTQMLERHWKKIMKVQLILQNYSFVNDYQQKCLFNMGSIKNNFCFFAQRS